MNIQTDLISIAQRIRHLRQKRGYSQESFANFIEMNRGYYGTIERGEANLTILNLLKIAQGLEILPGDLFSMSIVEDKYKKNIGEACSRDVMILEKSKTIDEAAKFIAQHQLKHLVVVEERENLYYPIGILTPLFFVNALANGVDTKNTKIEKSLRKKPVLFVKENHKIEEVLKIMAAKKINCVPVVDEDKKLIGITTIEDIILYLENEKSLILKAIAAQIPAHFNF